MATGVSKTKWNGDLKHHPNNNSLDVQLTYEGKQDESEILAIQPGQFTSIWGQGENLLYYGDNLHGLASLLQNPKICGKVNLIYIDPPFATKSVFQSRSQNDAYKDLLVGSHYIEFLRKRLILMRELLSKDGSIYIHLDENIAFHIKVIMDEIFGRNNFRNWITRKKCNPKNYTRKTYGDISDYIMFYTKSDSYTWNRPMDKWTEARANKEYEYTNENGRKYKKVPVHAPGIRNGETGKPWRGKLPPPGKHWQFTPKTLDEMDARGEIYWSPTGNPRRKIYLDQSEGINVQDIWLDFRDPFNQMAKITGYPTEKNPLLLDRIIRASSNPGDIVLDSFVGSGTTIEVASELGRKWIGMDNSSEAISVILRRFAKGTERMGDFVQKENETTLFDIDPLLRRSSIIKDFSLFSEENRVNDLTDIVKQWLEWINS